jgi:hypothetical protein
VPQCLAHGLAHGRGLDVVPLQFLIGGGGQPREVDVGQRGEKRQVRVAVEGAVEDFVGVLAGEV